MKKNIFLTITSIAIMFATINLDSKESNTETSESDVYSGTKQINISEIIKEECTINDIPEELKEIVWY